MMNGYQLIFDNVSVYYDADDESAKKNAALKNINIKIKKGEFVVILGANGSGKSTFAKLTNSVLYPSSGKVYVDGMDTTDEDKEFDIRKKVGLVFQNPDNQIVASIVEEDVAFGPENIGIPPTEIRKRVDNALKDVGMYEYRLHETHRLSGGQKQRVAIAGMIAMQPECIVLDEPTAMLDPQGRKEVMSTVRKLNKEYGITIIFITHFMEEAVKADRVVVINEAEICKDGSPADIFSDRTLLEKCSLDLPVVSEIAFLLRKKGIDFPELVLNEENFINSYLELIN